MTARMAVIIALAAIAPEVWAETENHSRTKGSIEEFRIYTKCLGVILVVEHLSEDAEKIGLGREEIIAAVESRLRAAGLYQSGYFGFPEGSVVFFPHLYVNVNVKGNAYSVLVELKKWVNEPLSGQLNFAQTWRIGKLGTQGSENPSIMSAVRSLTDQFVDEWNKVNKPDGKCVE